MWAQQRPSPGSQAFGQAAVHPDDPMCFRKTLTESGDFFRQVYTVLWPDSACQLNQNPDTSFETHGGGQVLATLIRNSQLVYWNASNPERWLTGTELLCVQGFPAHPELRKDCSIKLLGKWNQD